MAFLIISRYEDAESVTVSKNAEEIYYIQRGVYSNKKVMQESMMDFENYIYSVEDNMYHVYIGIAKSEKNAYKIKAYYKEKSIDTYIKKKITDNKSFLKILGQYDEILTKTNDSKTINVICNHVLSKYEELVNGEY